MEIHLQVRQDSLGRGGAVGRGHGDGTLAEGTVNHDEKNLLMKSVMVAKEKNR